MFPLASNAFGRSSLLRQGPFDARRFFADQSRHRAPLSPDTATPTTTASSTSTTTTTTTTMSGEQEKARTSGESPSSVASNNNNNSNNNNGNGPVLPTTNQEAKGEPPKSTFHPAVYVV